MTEITQQDLITDLDAIARKPRVERPRRTTGRTRACSPKQLSFAAVLVAEKCGGSPEDVDTSLWADMSVKEASATIDALKKGPKMTHENGTSFKTIPAGPPATEKQVAFVKRLVEQKGGTHPDYDALTKSNASSLIEELLAQPNASAPGKSAPDEEVNVPAGHYAVTGNDGTTDFYRVDRPTKGKWAGWTFVKLQVSDDYQRVSQAQSDTILKRIEEAGPREAAIRYGHELGKCSLCNRTLTNNDSIEAGIGPVCARNVGW